MAEPVYPHRPLETSGDWVRVLDILPGPRDSELDLHLRVVDLAHRPKYEALSYTWGASWQRRTARVDEPNLPVTDNSFRALQRLRWRFVKRTVWVDALCIKQHDVQEQETQVAIMGDIFWNATCVNLCWVNIAGLLRSMRHPSS